MLYLMIGSLLISLGMILVVRKLLLNQFEKKMSDVLKAQALVQQNLVRMGTRIKTLENNQKQITDTQEFLKGTVGDDFRSARELIKLGVGQDEVASACEMSTTEVELIKALQQGGARVEV